MIEKSHEHGIKVVGDDKNTRCMPYIWQNRIFTCGYNGILVMGEFCEPDIRGNIIEANHKAGIKITDSAIAHIGGTSKEDINILPQYHPVNIETVVVTAGENLQYID